MLVYQNTSFNIHCCSPVIVFDRLQKIFSNKLGFSLYYDTATIMAAKCFIVQAPAFDDFTQNLRFMVYSNNNIFVCF